MDQSPCAMHTQPKTVQIPGGLHSMNNIDQVSFNCIGVVTKPCLISQCSLLFYMQVDMTCSLAGLTKTQF